MSGGAGAGRRILIDVSTSLRWRGRNPVGIVRTERELAQYFVAHHPEAAFFIYEIEADAFWLVPRDRIAAIFGESQAQPAQAAPVSAVEPLDADVLLRFRPDDVVVSVGLQWDIGYMARLYAEKKRRGMFVVQMVYDIVPIVMPEYCVTGMEQRFPQFIVDTAWTADLILCISDSTRRDLARYYERLGLAAPAMRRVTLGSDIPTTRRAAAETLFGLESGQYALYVSTIEPRKNHRMLFDIWRELHATQPETLVPLIFVGYVGWNSGDLMTFLRGSEALYPDFVRILSDVSDDELDWLYRNARFTLYPSLYEGWGLPVAESLARGKVCLSSDSSSMPEVGGDLSDLLGPLDHPAWRDRIRHYLADPEALAAREAQIRDGFTVVSWTDSMRGLSETLFAALPG